MAKVSPEFLARMERADKNATLALYVLAAAVLALVCALVCYILWQGGATALSPGFLTHAANHKVLPGIAYQLWDSFYLLVVTLVISVPLSLGAAIFLSEYAAQTWIARVAQTAIEVLSSLPSIVVGMFGSMLFVAKLGWGISILAGACALTMFNIPLLVRTIQQALQDVPRSQHDAGLAMGLTRWETTFQIVLPAALPAIITGVVLASGRVFGEAAALIFTSGSAPARLNFEQFFNLASPTSPLNILRPACSLSVYIWRLTTEPSANSAQVVWGTATVLIVCVLLFNIAARLLGKALARKLSSE